ncbi:P-loop containing nucleoside triphosphate hydrolase protein [Abortiporus biennis]|nr:P-loop containing nucleoside triphosphate hydrolase protein [Abortiporus biennis]
MLTPYLVQQDVFLTPSSIMVIPVSDADLTSALLVDFLESATTGTIGVSASYGGKGALNVLTLATRTYILQITFNHLPFGSRKKNKFKRSLQGQSRLLLQDMILCNDEYSKLSLDMHRVATALYYDHGLFITSAIDLQSLVLIGRRHSFATVLTLIGGRDEVNKSNAFNVFMENSPTSEARSVTVRAWCAWKTSCLDLYTQARPSIQLVNTLKLPPNHLRVLANTVRMTYRLNSLKPTALENDVDTKFGYKSGSLHLRSTRFNTRIRVVENQRLVVETEGADGELVQSKGRARRVEGKTAEVSIKNEVPISGDIKVFTVGKGVPGLLEAERTNIVLGVLQGTSKIFHDPLVEIIYGLVAQLPSEPTSDDSIVKPDIVFERPLNPSQKRAVECILSTEAQDRVCMVQGPPGTGKTTVIAASTINIVRSSQSGNKRSVWLIAQSNVAVKNIAEKLAQSDFFDFKLLVSFDFHFDWHEHLYEKIEKNIIRSDTFNQFSADSLQDILKDCRVMLCTISMLSSPLLISAGFTTTVPPETVVVDEASQIEVGDYLPMFNMLGKSIRKIVYIGDDKQLPPHGESVGARSIFEMTKLRERAVFLDTQYRMPSPIGDFISKHVYDAKLLTEHAIDCRSSCRLVDVHHGTETAHGTSWVVSSNRR